ncbi:MAG: Fe-S-containing protein [Eubacteriales bacterium]|nr:Fe-S-containing protein [Eubacteriales bacterium]
MLNYLITVTEDLFITVTLLVMLLEYGRRVWGKNNVQLMRAGIIGGMVASIIMALAKNLTSKVATNKWNLWIFLFTTALSVLYVIFSCIYSGSEEKRKQSKGSVIMGIFAGLLLLLLLFYEVPDVISYPFLFDTGKSGVVSLAFLYRLLGWIFALVLLYIYGHYLAKSIRALRNFNVFFWALNVAVLINAFRCVGQALRPWVSRAKWLPDFFPKYSKADFPWAFPLTKFVANNTVLFTILVAATAVCICIALIIQYRKVIDPYENPAQLRRWKAIGRKNRHGAETVLVCFCLAVTILTVVKAYTNKTVELSSPEEYTVEEDQIIVPITEVEDGHLHRFEYKTKDNIAVRWIVIKKPGSAAYGVGLDAWDVCGDAGYYERGDQVVCKRCDVVMNIQTIGFKGGCNPIPLAYTVKDGKMFFALQDIIDGAKEFK